MILGPTAGELTDDEVVAAYPWPPSTAQGKRWIRAMMVTTLDGAASGPDGLSGSISGDADKAVFDAVRREADAVIIGAGTMRAERYGPFKNRARLAIVTRSLDLPWDEAVFHESREKPLILTGRDADTGDVPDTCEIVVVEDDPHAYIAALEARGLTRIVAEGGPSLLRDLVAAGLVDEADITVSPTFTGTSHSPDTDSLPDVSHFDLEHLLTKDGFVMGRYVRNTEKTG